MANLTYYSYDGVGKRDQGEFWYSQAVRVGDRIECAGQGGWDPRTAVIPCDLEAEIDQAFANVDLSLKDAGGKGWEQVFRVNSYHTPMTKEVMDAMVHNLRQWMPNHQPIWTAVGVVCLARAEARVEIEVVALDP